MRPWEGSPTYHTKSTTYHHAEALQSFNLPSKSGSTMADRSGYKMHTYVLTANVSTYVKYVYTFVCQNYLHKIVLLCIFVSACHKQICRAQLSYVNSSDTQMYRHILHMWKHLWSIHIYLNILNMLKNS